MTFIVVSSAFPRLTIGCEFRVSRELYLLISTQIFCTIFFTQCGFPYRWLNINKIRHLPRDIFHGLDQLKLLYVHFSSIVLNCPLITNSANKYVQDTSVNLNRVMSLFSGANGVIHCFVFTICFRSLGLNRLTQLNAHLLSDAKKLEYL